MFKKRFPKFGQSSRHREGLENYLKSIIVNGSVLDIGGGQKPIINRLSTKSNIEKYQILDLPNPHSSSVTNVSYEIDIQSPILNNRLLSTHFDAIFCLEVSLYWHDPMQALRNIVDLMSPGTKLYINFHQFYANQKPISSDMLRYNFDWIEKISKLLNLRIIDIHLSSLTKLSYFALIFLYKSERMRSNMHYKYLNSSSFLVILEMNND